MMLDRMMPSPLMAKARFVVMLREPVARALSAFNHVRLWASVNDASSAKAGPDGGPLHCVQTMQSASRTRDGNISFAQMTACTINNPSELMVSAGHYADHLERWTRHVARRNLLVTRRAPHIRSAPIPVDSVHSAPRVTSRPPHHSHARAHSARRSRSIRCAAHH